MLKRSRTLLYLILAAILLAFLSFAPWRTNFEQRLSAIKLDADGNVISTTEILVRGVKANSLLDHSLQEITFDSFDGHPTIKDIDLSMASINPINNSLYISLGIGDLDTNIPTPDSPEFGSVTTSSFSFHLTLDENQQFLLIEIRPNNDSPVFYVASFDNESKEDSLLDFFHQFR